MNKLKFFEKKPEREYYPLTKRKSVNIKDQLIYPVAEDFIDLDELYNGYIK